MTFFTIVSRSLTRRPVRTGLTLVGISIGIAAVVALVGMAWGYEKSVGKQIDVIGIDAIVSPKPSTPPFRIRSKSCPPSGKPPLC
jgi:putative ABC transport system permease protein